LPGQEGRLKDLTELPSLKELEELSRAVLGDSEEGIEPAAAGSGRPAKPDAPGRELTGGTADEDIETGEFEPEAEEDLPGHTEDRVSENENEEPEAGEIEAETVGEQHRRD
jgi:hypothetical protein